MKKKFIKPELYSVRLNLNENIAYSYTVEWSSLIGAAFIAWSAADDTNCHDYISGDSPGLIYKPDGAAPYTEFLTNKTNFYQIYGGNGTLDNCRSGVYPPQPWTGITSEGTDSVGPASTVVTLQ